MQFRVLTYDDVICTKIRQLYYVFIMFMSVHVSNLQLFVVKMNVTFRCSTLTLAQGATVPGFTNRLSAF